MIRPYSQAHSANFLIIQTYLSRHFRLAADLAIHHFFKIRGQQDLEAEIIKSNKASESIFIMLGFSAGPERDSAGFKRYVRKAAAMRGANTGE